MEAKEHLHYLKKSLVFVIVFGLVVGVIAWVFAAKRPAMYKAIVTYQLELVNRPATTDYQYGSYYDLKGAEIFTQHVISMVHSAAVIEDIYRQASIDYTIDNADRFTNQFRTDQDSAQQFTVTFSRYDETEASALAGTMSAVLSELVATAQEDDAGQSLFRLQTHPPVIIYETTNVWLVTVVAVLAGWIFAVVLVYLKRYLQT